MKKLARFLSIFLNQYYFTGVLIFGFLSGGVVFYLSYLRSVTIPPEIIYCLENKDVKECKGKRLNRKRLRDRKIKKIVFARCRCKDVHLLNVVINHSDFREGQFKRAYLKNVSFFNVDLFKSSFYGAILENVIFENSELGGVIFNFATFRNVYFKNVDLRSTVFVGARFKNSYYDRKTKLPFSKKKADRIGLVSKQ